MVFFDSTDVDDDRFIEATPRGGAFRLRAGRGRQEAGRLPGPLSPAVSGLPYDHRKSR